MPTRRHILRILGEAIEPLFLSEISDRLNRERGAGPPNGQVVMYLQSLGKRVEQLPAGLWTLNQRRAERIKQ